MKNILNFIPFCAVGHRLIQRIYVARTQASSCTQQRPEYVIQKVEHLVVLHGGMRAPHRREMLQKLFNTKETETRVILATGPYIGEGFDDPRLDTLFLAMPFSFKGKMVQYAGRLHRQRENKKEIRIYDYVDSKMSIFEKMYKRRLKFYKFLGYKRSTAVD